MSVRLGGWSSHGLWVLMALLCSPIHGSAQGPPRTVAERSAFTRYTPYDSMWSYLGEVQDSGIEMRLGVYGTSLEGRRLPYAVFSRPSVTQPWEAWALGKPILVLAAGVHGGEPALRESLLMLAREFATRGTEMNVALDQLTVLVVPQINPDGFSAEPTQRGNVRGIDLNRDYMKLEQPEIQSYVQNILLSWAPDLLVDGHDGGSPPYNIAYQCPSHSAADSRITALCDEQIFPAVDRRLEREGLRSWYYQRGNATRWDVGGSDPRIGRNYGGFANMVGILFEAPPTQGLATSVRSGLLAYEAVVEWARDNPDLLKETVRAARVQAIELGATPSGQVPIDVEYAPEPERVSYLLQVGPPGSPDVRRVESDSLMKRPVTTLARPRPWAYVLPPEAVEAVRLLRRHRVQVERLTESVTLDVDAYTIADISYESAYDHAAATKIDVGEEVPQRRSLPEGSYVVRTGQMQGRIAAHLLEPETRDRVVYWNRMDAWLPKDQVEAFKAGRGEAPFFPIYKLMRPTPLRTLLVSEDP